MVKIIYRYLLITIAIVSIVLGVIALFLPVIPTSPFLILALACFARSSSSFHQKLLNLPYIGESLRDWEQEKKIEKKRKIMIFVAIIVSFSVSIILLREWYLLQLLVFVIMLVLLLFIHSIDEK
jgi:hypothetical protein